jgi:hypothetical protein
MGGGQRTSRSSLRNKSRGVEGRPNKRAALSYAGVLGAAGCHEGEAEEQADDEAGASGEHR